MAKKTDQIEYERRVRVVMEWILEGWPSIDMITQMYSWGIEERQAKRYIAEARTRWKAEPDPVVEQKRKLKVLSLKRQIRNMKEQYRGTPRGIAAVVAIEKLIIQLEGIKPATKFELTGADGKPIETKSEETKVVYLTETNVDYTKLPDAVLQQIVAARKSSNA